MSEKTTEPSTRARRGQPREADRARLESIRERAAIVIATASVQPRRINALKNHQSDGTVRAAPTPGSHTRLAEGAAVSAAPRPTTRLRLPREQVRSPQIVFTCCTARAGDPNYRLRGV
jgi:hypothetical protein